MWIRRNLGFVLSFFLLALAGLFADSPEPASNKDWSQFRGPNRDNLSSSKGLLSKWTKAGPAVIWKATGVGQGFSSVVVAGNKVFTMGDKGGAAYLFALDRRSGKQLWATKVGKPGGNFTGPRCTPTVDGDKVFGIGQFGDLVCLKTGDGSVVWRKNFARDFGGRAGSWNFTESPLIDGDRLICTPGGKAATMVALNKTTGKEIWRSPIDHVAGYSSIVISNAVGVKQYVQLTSMGTIGVRASDGKLLWQYDRFAHNTANIPTPIILKDQVFTVAGYDRAGALLTLSSDGAGGIKANEEYYNTALKNKHGGVLIVGDLAFGDRDDSGNPYCADWKTGKVLWTRPRNGTCPGRGSASLTYADGHLYIRYSNGWVALVKADKDGYKESGAFKIPNSDANSWAHPVVVDGKLFLREKDMVWCYDVKAK